ncbi:MAG TPA: hypothetical protein VKV26_05420 [Dehalococcoidia bacterium]|nr:hypothetical protein [Dehalococcoidia bacterium]
MLGMKTYSHEYIDGCRSNLEADLAAYRGMVAARGSSSVNETPRHSVFDAFEAVFFNNMVIVLDSLFVHRLRVIEGKDGNALNEVRMLCASLMEHAGVMTLDKSIKWSPAKSVLKYQDGDEIKLSEADFALLSQAFFTEIERKYL